MPSENFDVIVVGAGLAGCSAALSATEAGARVLLLEKQPAPGGSSRMSGGGFAFAGVEAQRLAGIADSPEKLRADFERMGEGFADPALVQAYVARQADTQAWLSSHGVQFTSLQTGSGNSVPRVLRTHPPQLIDALLAAIDRQGGVTRRVGVRAERLLRDERGRINGLRVIEQGQQRDIAARAVVLASGGFSRNPELVATFAPEMLKAVPVGGDGSTGDGLRMACAVGAGLRDMGFVRATFGSHRDAAGANNGIKHAMYKGAVIVNEQGRRFVNESIPYKQLGSAHLAQPGRMAWQIFDQTVMDHSDPFAGPYDFKAALAQGWVLQADTLAELAAKAGLPADALMQEVATYNQAIAKGTPDAFGRVTLPGGAARTPIVNGPFYALPSVTVLLATYCGLAIDADAHVLDAFGQVIPGLYAAGEITGGVHGAGYLSGSSLGKAAIFGRSAGRLAAREARQARTQLA